MAKQLSFEEAKQLAIIKWESHVRANGTNLDVDCIEELQNLRHSCGFCERWKRKFYCNCGECEFMKIAGRCAKDGSLYDAWINSHKGDELKHAIKILEVIKSL